MMSILVNGDKVIKAIIWDYDGTLVDSRRKNYQVTRKIVQAVTDRPADEYYVLQSFESYRAATYRVINWRELYTNEFDFSKDETDLAGKLWTTYQLKDDTPVKVFDGLDTVLESLDKYPQGIVSMNGKVNIAKVLEENKLSSFFDTIIGYEEVPFNQQKPAPEPLSLCLGQLIDSDPGLILYIGDHKTDFVCARNTNGEFEQSRQQRRVISVGALYGYLMENTVMSVKPDYLALHPADILKIINQVSIAKGDL